MSDDEDKSEEPTDKKLREAREKGQVVHSREVNTWVLLTTAAILITTASVWLCNRLAEILRQFIAQPHAYSMDGGAIATLLKQSVGDVVTLLMIPLGIMCFFAFLAGFLQTGPLITTEPLTPNFEKLDPIKGAKRLFGVRAWTEFVKALLKLIIIGSITTVVLWPIYEDSRGMVGVDLTTIIDFLLDVVEKLFTAVCSIFFLFAAIDYIWQRMQHNKQLMMSRGEIKDEYKQAEGDPHIKAKLRQLRMDRARRRMLLNVPKADVVITNPTHFAVAMEYKQDKSGAPVVVAKGQDNIALKIREIAKENNVPIVQNPPLARALYDTVELDQEIPEQHYKAVAEIISYVFSLKRR